MPIARLMMGVLLAAACAACGPKSSLPPAPPRERPVPLRVGFFTEMPPMAFYQGGVISGLEVDFAKALGHELERPVRFVDLRWDELIPALMERQIDVIMAGMTVTRARAFRVAFGDPYLQSGLVMCTRRKDRSRYDTLEKLKSTNARVGVRQGTTGEKFVEERLPKAIVSAYPTSMAAGLELQQNRIDVYINDAPAIAWLVSENEALAGVWTLLTKDDLAWGFRPGDPLREQANAVLARWRRDGTLRAMLHRWLRGWPGL